MTMLTKTVRDHLADVILATKTQGLTHPETAAALSNAIVDGLDRIGLMIIGDGIDGAAESGNELALLKAMQLRISTAVADPDCPARDLAALSRRLHELAKDISTIEERIKQEAKGKANGSANTSTGKSGASRGKPVDV